MIRHSTGIGERFTARWYLSILGRALLWAVIAVDAWFLWPATLGGGTTAVIVSGNSMEPTLRDGDLVLARVGEVNVGDIIVYEPKDLGGARIVHRIVGGDAHSGWQLQGDNNSWIDQWSPSNDEVVGGVTLHFSGGGRVATFLISPWLWGFFVLAAVVLIMWPESRPARDGGAAGREDAGPVPQSDAKVRSRWVP